jgi:hypothetical protein
LAFVCSLFLLLCAFFHGLGGCDRNHRALITSCPARHSTRSITFARPEQRQMFPKHDRDYLGIQTSPIMRMNKVDLGEFLRH